MLFRKQIITVPGCSGFCWYPGKSHLQAAFSTPPPPWVLDANATSSQCIALGQMEAESLEGYISLCWGFIPSTKSELSMWSHSCSCAPQGLPRASLQLCLYPCLAFPTVISCFPYPSSSWENSHIKSLNKETLSQALLLGNPTSHNHLSMPALSMEFWVGSLSTHMVTGRILIGPGVLKQCSCINIHL